MAFVTPSIPQFKAYFFRDFPYLSNIEWNILTNYIVGDKVFYSVTELFYEAILNNVGQVPTDIVVWKIVSDKQQNYILDLDIQKAFDEATYNINQACFGTQEEFDIPFFYLSAHYLVQDLLASSQGLTGSYSWLTVSKSVGNVSQSFGIPPYILNSPQFAYISTTRYGAKYISLIIPCIIGGVVSVAGATHP